MPTPDEIPISKVRLDVAKTIAAALLSPDAFVDEQGAERLVCRALLIADMLIVQSVSPVQVGKLLVALSPSKYKL